MREDRVGRAADVVCRLLAGDPMAAHEWSIRPTWSTTGEQAAALNRLRDRMRDVAVGWLAEVDETERADDWTWAFHNGIEWQQS
jgi:hypothetical protein